MTGTNKKFNVKMLLRSIFAIAMIAALLLGCVACSTTDSKKDDDGGKTNNENNKKPVDPSRYEGLSDAEYFQTLTTDSMGSTVDALAAGIGAYADMLSMGTTMGDFGAEAEIELMLGDMLIDLLEEQIFGGDTGMDFSFLSSIGLDMEIESNSELAQMQIALGLNDTEIIALAMLFNMESAWVGVPDLSNSYLEMNFADLGIDLEAATATLPSWVTTIDQYMPSEETLATILNRYLALVVKEIDSVERTTETLTLDGLSQEATKLDVKIYEQDALDAVKAVLTAAKTDNDIKKIVEDFGDFYNDMMAEMYAEYDMQFEEVDAYAEFTKLIDETLNELPAEAETTDSYIGVILYVDGGHNIVGCSLDMGLLNTQAQKAPAENVVVTSASADASTPNAPDQQESFIVFTYYTVTEGGNFATIFETADDEFVITGKGTNKNGVVSGTYAITVEELTAMNVVLKDIDTTKADAVKGTITLKPTEDLMTYIFNGPNPLGIDDVALELTLDIDGNKADVTAKLIGDDAMIVGIGLKLATKTPGNIKIPTNTVDINDQTALMNWVAGIDFDEIIDNLGDAGVPSELLSVLENRVPAM